MSNAAEARDLLTPGSIWLSPKNKPSFVLFVTNENIPKEKREEFPPQVVFAADDGELFNVDVDRFLAHRTFYNVDGELEHRIDNLLVFKDEDEDDEDDAETLQVADIEPTSESADAFQPDEASPIRARALRGVFQFDDNPELALPALNSLQLDAALVSYSQDAEIEQNMLLHRLTFELTGPVTIETLQATFNPVEGQTNNTRSLSSFTIQSLNHIDSVTWNLYAGVYASYDRVGGVFGTVLLGTDGLFSALKDNDTTDWFIQDGENTLDAIHAVSQGLEVLGAALDPNVTGINTYQPTVTDTAPAVTDVPQPVYEAAPVQVQIQPAPVQQAPLQVTPVVPAPVQHVQHVHQHQPQVAVQAAVQPVVQQAPQPTATIQQAVPQVPSPVATQIQPVVVQQA